MLTSEGVTREARYEEKMLRRPGHVWVVRVLPKAANEQHDAERSDDLRKKVALKTKDAEHEQFNHVVNTRQVVLEK